MTCMVWMGRVPLARQSHATSASGSGLIAIATLFFAAALQKPIRYLSHGLLNSTSAPPSSSPLSLPLSPLRRLVLTNDEEDPVRVVVPTRALVVHVPVREVPLPVHAPVLQALERRLARDLHQPRHALVVPRESTQGAGGWREIVSHTRPRSSSEPPATPNVE